MSSDQAIHIVGVVVLMFVFRYLHEWIATKLRERRSRKARAARQP